MSEHLAPSYEDVVASAREGSPWALGWLYRRFQPGLLRLLVVIAPHHAEDTAADVWLDVAGGLPRFSGDERELRGWLAATARGRVIATHRRSETRAERCGTVTEEQLATFAAEMVSVLPPDETAVVLLRVVGRFEVEEVARLLRRPPPAIRSLQHRALRRLARQPESEHLLSA